MSQLNNSTSSDNCCHSKLNLRQIRTMQQMPQNVIMESPKSIQTDLLPTRFYYILKDRVKFDCCDNKKLSKSGVQNLPSIIFTC